MKSLLARSTLLAALLSVLAILALNLFATRVMHPSGIPADFASWPGPKKEAYLYEHPTTTVKGVDLLELWLHEPSNALPIVVPQVVVAFPLCWLASFLGGLWQMRGGRHNYSLKRTAASRHGVN